MAETTWRYCQLVHTEKGVGMLVDNGNGRWEFSHLIKNLIDGEDLIIKQEENNGQRNETEDTGTDKND